MLSPERCTVVLATAVVGHVLYKLVKNSQKPKTIWSFGIGSNMDLEALAVKKNVKVLNSTPAILKGWVMRFSIPAMTLVEPSFANVERGGPTDEVHGVVFEMSLDCCAKLDAVEQAYKKTTVQVLPYPAPGQKAPLYISAFVYENKKHFGKEIPPSRRYLDVLVRGARMAGLHSTYIAKLQNTKTYTASADTLRARETVLVQRANLPPMTAAELAQFQSAGNGPAERVTRVSVLGIVIEAPESKVWFRSHRLRDVTFRMVKQWAGLALDEDDDNGLPPYPLLTDLEADEKEFISNWLDQYLSVGKAVGYLKEFWDTQDDGRTTWKHPKQIKSIVV
eukprot:gb/GEZN01011280.1/.p1 GENE.gb/GEZN01011280.1/~~gb/GEZN01011280.1/.p1  ORF type:complete len:335 (+),score=36.36 gb/GEZN01011280.1/:104-1108(+)